MANDPEAIMVERVTAVQRWLTAHGGAVDESDPDAQRDLVETFMLPALAKAWREGWSAGLHQHRFPAAPPNPYEPLGHIFTARDFWRGLRVAVENDAEEHVRTLFAHGVYKNHCGGYDVHAWPCYPASVVLADLRELVGHAKWLAVDPFSITPDDVTENIRLVFGEVAQG